MLCAPGGRVEHGQCTQDVDIHAQRRCRDRVHHERHLGRGDVMHRTFPERVNSNSWITVTVS